MGVKLAAVASFAEKLVTASHFYPSLDLVEDLNFVLDLGSLNG